MVTKKKKTTWIILLCLIFGFALGAAGFVAYKQYWPQLEGSKATLKNTPKPTTTANPLDGTQTSKDLAGRNPLAVIIENHPQARPQAGLDKASIVYEAITEGGITRFMAIFGPQDADTIGPVRSIRTYFLDWCWEYDCLLAHCGGNIDALDRIQSEKVKDLDEFTLGDSGYWREPSAGKATEHTMFTDLEKLYSEAGKREYILGNKFTAFKFLKPKEAVSNPNATQEITIDFSSPQYQVKYYYDPTANNYRREMGGSLHKDRETGNLLTPTNIIIQSVERWEAPTRINESGWAMKTIGEGKAYVIHGGIKIDATWKKKDLRSRTMFYDSSGKELSFIPGQFWYEIVPPDVFDKVVITEGTKETPE